MAKIRWETFRKPLANRPGQRRFNLSTRQDSWTRSSGRLYAGET
jgi:hypothetical protein